jgi:hypothetical protein
MTDEQLAKAQAIHAELFGRVAQELEEGLSELAERTRGILSKSDFGRISLTLAVRLLWDELGHEGTLRALREFADQLSKRGRPAIN